LIEKNSVQIFLKNLIPKLLKAAVKGILWFFLLYFIPQLLFSDLGEGILPGYTEFLLTFAAVIVFFVVVSELLAGTIFQYALDVGKALAFMMLFIYALNGGFIVFDLPKELGSVRVEADLRVYLAMLLTVDFLGLARSVLQAVDFLARKTEQQLTIYD
jgi:hypothetical protein